VVEAHEKVKDDSLDKELAALREKANEMESYNLAEMEDEEIDQLIQAMDSMIADYEGYLTAISEIKDEEEAAVLTTITLALTNQTGFSFGEIHLYEKGDVGAHVNILGDMGMLAPEQSLTGLMIQRDVDACVMQAESFEEFLGFMAEKGYDVRQNKYLAVRPKGMQRFCRCKSMGENYTEDRIWERIRQESFETYAKRERGEESHAIEPPEDEFLRRTKLTGIQKTYYARICRLRHLERLPYSKAWEYREDIMRMKELQDDYLFLCKYGIHTRNDLDVVAGKISENRKSISSEKSLVYRERAKIKPLFGAAAEIKGLQVCENCFQRGDMVFKEEHKRYMELLEQIGKEGYTAGQLENLQEDFKRKISIIQQKEKETAREGRIACRIIEELKLRGQEMEKKVEKQAVLCAQKNKGQERNNQRGSR